MENLAAASWAFLIASARDTGAATGAAGRMAVGLKVMNGGMPLIIIMGAVCIIGAGCATAGGSGPETSHFRFRGSDIALCPGVCESEPNR